MKEEIPVKQEHIKEGRKAIKGHICEECALALAVRERYPHAAVGGWSMWLFRPNVNSSFALSEQVIKWLKAFDRRKPVEPFTLILDHEAKTAEMGIR